MALDGWKERLFQRYLVWSCRPARIRRRLRAVLPHPRPVMPVDRRRIRAAALQLELKLYKSPFEYADDMHRLVKIAVDKGARLIVFPEYCNLLLVGLLPGIEEMEQDFREKEEARAGLEAEPVSEENNDNDEMLAALFRYMSPAVEPLVHTIFSGLAGAYGCYIMAGSFALAENSSVYNRAFLYGPEGRLIGSQDKVHLMVESEWHLTSGSSFAAYETTLGKMAVPVCMDATYYETFRVLEMKGVEIAMVPIANNEAYNYWLALRGIWPRVQESPLYGIKSALVGSLAGMTFTGRAGVYAPLELTPGKNGILAEAEPHDREAIAVADLDLEALHELRRRHPWRDSNPALYHRYFPAIYWNR